MNAAVGGSPPTLVGTSPALSFVCYGARILVLDAAGSGVADRVRPHLPREAQVGPVGEPDVCYEVLAREPEEPTPAPTYQVTRNGHPCFRVSTIESIARWLRSDVDLQVATHAREGLFVHAGAVGWRDHAILVPGRTMTGKSSLVAALVRQGARYYSDEYAVIDDGGRVHPYTRPLSLRHGSEVDSAALTTGLGDPDRAPIPVALIVSAVYREGAPWDPVMVRGARAVMPLVDNTVLAASAPTRTIHLAAQVAPSVVMLQGPRPEAETVAPKLLQFVDALLDGQPARLESPTGAIASPRWGGYDLPRPRRPARDDGAAGPTQASPYPARYLRIENVLEPAEHQRLLDYVRTHESEFRPSRVLPLDGPVGVDPRVRQARDKVGLGEVWDLFEPRLRRLLPRVRQALRVPWFPLGRIERHVVAHAAGDFFGVHTDSGRAPVAGRRITGVYYFNWAPKRFSGGQLRLYDGVLRRGRLEPATTYTTVEPVDNSLVFFSSELFHEVCPVHGDTTEFRDGRFAVNVWYWAEQSDSAGS